jgi:hypothetical protein
MLYCVHPFYPKIGKTFDGDIASPQARIKMLVKLQVDYCFIHELVLMDVDFLVFSELQLALKVDPQRQRDCMPLCHEKECEAQT